NCPSSIENISLFLRSSLPKPFSPYKDRGRLSRPSRGRRSTRIFAEKSGAGTIIDAIRQGGHIFFLT
ncbi:MAG: hypothetical protein WAO07_08455, partial [Desulfobacterales bacterium]